jgi:hypothetical protein
MKRKFIYIEEEDDNLGFKPLPTFNYPGYTGDPYSADPCERCSNNPKNNTAASGVCWCILGNRMKFTC